MVVLLYVPSLFSCTDPFMMWAVVEIYLVREDNGSIVHVCCNSKLWLHQCYILMTNRAMTAPVANSVIIDDSFNFSDCAIWISRISMVSR